MRKRKNQGEGSQGGEDEAVEKRTVTICKQLQLQRQSGKKEPIEFDDEGEIPLVGIPNRESQDKWISYLGLLARVKVNTVDWPDWRTVNALVKKSIWKEMRVSIWVFLSISH